MLRRDGFKCKACGRSPANEPGCELQVDHIVAWSSGAKPFLVTFSRCATSVTAGSLISALTSPKRRPVPRTAPFTSLRVCAFFELGIDATFWHTESVALKWVYD
jgi:hypothetical protein